MDTSMSDLPKVIPALAYPLRFDQKPRATWPEGLRHEAGRAVAARIKLDELLAHDPDDAIEPFTVREGEWSVRFPDGSVDMGPWNSRGAALAGGHVEWHRKQARSPKPIEVRIDGYVDGRRPNRSTP